MGLERNQSSSVEKCTADLNKLLEKIKIKK